MKIGIITAMADETTPLYQKMGKATGEIKVAGVTIFKYDIDGNEIFLVRSGVGEIRAAMTFQLLVDKFDVDAVLNFGFVGSLDNRFDVWNAYSTRILPAMRSPMVSRNTS